MMKHESSRLKAGTCAEIGECWDTHALSRSRDKTKPAHIDVAMGSEITYYAMDKKLSEEIQDVALAGA